MNKKYYTLIFTLVLLISSLLRLDAQCYDLRIESAGFDSEPLALEGPNQLSYTICNTGDALPVSSTGGVRINICPSVLNLLQISQFEGSGLNYFQFGSFFNCSIAEQITTIPADECFDFIVSYEVRVESEIGEYSTDDENTGVHCISTNIVPSANLIASGCNIPENDYLKVCSYSIGDTMVHTDNILATDIKNLAYPNPAVDMVRFALSPQVEYLELHRLDGSIEARLAVTEIDEMSVKSYQPGVYILKYIDKESRILSSQKLLIMK